MKHARRSLSALLALLMLLSLFAACSSNEKGNDFGDGYYPPNNGPDFDIEMEVGTQEEAETDGGIDTNADPNAPLVKENPFIPTAENNISTFSADVDTASYAYFRKLVSNGMGLDMLKKYAVNFRTEEFINYFKYSAPQPAENEAFGMQTEIVACPWNANTVLMRLTLQAESSVAYEGNNLVFLIDVSGSMNSNDKLGLLKTSFSYLIGNLGADDRVSIVTYSGKEAVILDGCSGADSQTILSAVNSLKASGSTNGEAGLTKAYEIAEKNYLEGGNNRIIMASDGDLNVGISSKEELKAFVEQKRDGGIYLSVLGFGSGNYRDANMEALADNGNGVYYYIDGTSEAEKVFGTDLLGTLYTVAQDVKLQLEFDPQYISSYRLIGYENRMLSEEDFEDDTKDAGDVGSGHQVTVCYELTLAEGARTAGGPWMMLAIRHKAPGETVSQEHNYAIGAQNLPGEVREDTAFISCVIRTVMILHNSKYAKNLSLIDVLEDLQALDLSDHPDRAEFRDLIAKIVNDQ
ncbi:MAG: von Willebrand factor type A domain-containing protein [Clostridia bacterium]|nr:von Willebrand factor type A domain-containing protein [Clostridia bacterium]